MRSVRFVSGSFSFDWDTEKYAINREKHGIRFEDAAGVFNDMNAVYMPDEAHSDEEERFIAIGFSNSARLLTVCHCHRYGGVIRLISARKAVGREIKIYGGRK